MCLATVSLDSNGIRKEVMKDVTRIEARDEGFVLTGLFGEERFVRGRLKSMDFVEGKSVITEE